MVYAPPERNIADMIATAISRVSNHHCLFAPLGLQALSDEWKTQIQKDLNQCDDVLVIMTESSLKDESVIWRVEQVLNLKKRLIPVGWNNFSFSKEIDPRITQLHYYNMFVLREEFLEESINRIVRWLPIETTLLCFLSYSRKDSEFTAKLASDLRQTKIRTWRDAENIPAGTNWDREIEKAIKECTHVILVASSSSVESENVMDEISLAINKGKTIIPVMIETCELPMRIHRAQWVDFREGYQQGITKLLAQLGVRDKDDN